MNETIYYKLQLQADEARYQGMVKLAEVIEETIGSSPVEVTEYSCDQMNNDIYKDLWSIATKLMVYHNIDNVDIDQVNKSLVSWAERIIDDIEKTLEINNNVKGPLENKLPGEK